MRRIKLTKGKFALIDSKDYRLVSAYRWYALKPNSHVWYACTSFNVNGTKQHIYMHHLIMGFKGIDHKNCNGLDNRRSNLRKATQSQNFADWPKYTGTASRYKGVSRHCNRFYARIAKDRTTHYLGIFRTQKEAALAYNEAATRLYGEFARLNKVR